VNEFWECRQHVVTVSTLFECVWWWLGIDQPMHHTNQPDSGQVMLLKPATHTYTLHNELYLVADETTFSRPEINVKTLALRMENNLKTSICFRL